MSWHAKSPQSGVKKPKIKDCLQGSDMKPLPLAVDEMVAHGMMSMVMGVTKPGSAAPIVDNNSELMHELVQERNSGTAIVANYEYVCF